MIKFICVYDQTQTYITKEEFCVKKSQKITEEKIEKVSGGAKKNKIDEEKKPKKANNTNFKETIDEDFLGALEDVSRGTAEYISNDRLSSRDEDFMTKLFFEDALFNLTNPKKIGKPKK